MRGTPISLDHHFKFSEGNCPVPEVTRPWANPHVPGPNPLRLSFHLD
jgi:hypothetical protein